MADTGSEFDRIELIALRTGKPFADWESLTITDDFLAPCASFSMESGGEVAPVQLMRDLPVGSPVEFRINGTAIMTGQVDHAIVKSGRGGSALSITGRDFLSRLVDSNIDPRMQVSKGIDIEGLTKLVMSQFAMRGNVVDNGGEVRPIGKPKKGKPYSAKHKRKDPLKEITPQANQGAFDYLSKILTHSGYWLWAAPKYPDVVVAGPDYEQASAYSLTHLRGANGGRNNILESTAEVNETSVPTHVYVKGVSTGAGAKTGYTAFASQGITSTFKAVFIDDKDATTQEKAERIARTFLARKMTELMVYNCTVAGFTGVNAKGDKNVFCVDTIASVNDEGVGVKGDMWVESRTFKKNRGSGSTTELKLIPPKVLLLDWQPDETVAKLITYEQAALDANKPGEFEKNRAYTLNGVTFFIPRA